MKKVIFSVLMIAIVGSLVGIGTWAFFSDYETSPDNIFTAGDLDLKVDGEDDPNVITYFSAPCLKPGDEGMVEINLANVGCVDGVADIHLKNMVSDDNGLTEPESDVDATGGAGEGELCCNLDMKITADLDGDGNFETLVAEGKACDIECINWIIGDLPGESDIDIMIEWGIDAAVGNIIQTDDCSFDIEFSLNQKVGDVIMDVTDIIQDPEGNVCDQYVIELVVHNAGTIAGNGWVFVQVFDAAGVPVYSDKVYVEGLAPCDTTTVVFTWHPTAAGSYTVVATPSALEPCPVDIFAGANLVVTGIQQPEMIQVCEDLVIAVDVHNAGDAPSAGGEVLMVAIADPVTEDILWGIAFFPMDPIAPCDHVKVPVDVGHVDESWRAAAGGTGMIAAIAGFSMEEFFPCPILVLMPPTIVVTGIQQPTGVQPCEDIIISVDVHNDGDKPGSGTVSLWIEDEAGMQIWPAAAPHATGETLPLNPCDTDKVPFGPIHIEDAWLGMTITVWAQAGNGTPVSCPINVAGGPCIVVTGIQQPEVVEPCEELVVAVDVHNVGGKPGECQVEVWLTDEYGEPIAGPFFELVPLLVPCETIKIPIVIGHVEPWWPPIVVVWAVSCCGEPFECPITVLKPVPPIDYEADGVMLLWTSMAGAPAEEPMPSPAICGFTIEYGDVQSTSPDFRALTIPAGSWWWFPYCGIEPVELLGYATINVIWDPAHPEGGDGRVYVTEQGQDVDVAGETTEAGTVLTYGDGDADPAGSANIHLYLQADVYSQQVGPADPMDPSTWGALVLPIPIEFYFTTEMATNHVTDTAEPATPGVALTCVTVSEGPGTPFAATGGPAPYVGTSATIVATGGLLDLIVLGFVELDVQYQMNLPITPVVGP